ncbi:ankyrin repeat domain-containing protein [Capnocytophaga sp.]|uniref:ankyrin repeat domain-containing protein n=1 Tax=Capnocytophaga sp. TaxID=44737 RepID=UPI0026DCBED6|nr:ankyrin repeat domain-containing protein [Capnocytophaga sp.]
MMKKIIFSFCIVISGWLSAQQNVFLSNDYWKTKPTVLQVKQKIAEGNDPTALNERAYDAVSLAINNDAPYETILYLLSIDGNSVHKLTHDKRTYLFWAALNNNLPVAEYLLKNGAQTNVRDSHQYSPILFAAVRGNTQPAIYDLLLKYGANIHDVNENGANVLLLAIPHMKDLKEANYFIKKGLSLKATDTDGNNALFYAARNGNKIIVNQLMKQKISAKVLNKKGQNLLFAAAEGARMKSNSLEFFTFIEKLDVNPNQKDNEGLTPLHTLAARHRDEAVIKYFIAKGNDVNQMDKQGNTTLMNASLRNTPEIVALLAEKTTAINAKNNQGHSALTQAVTGNKADVVRILLQKGADINVKDNQGNTLVYHLIKNYNARDTQNFNEKWQLLTENGVNFAQNQSGNENVYHLAIEKNSLDLMHKVATTKADINAKNKDGLSPLHKAVMSAKNLEIIEFLLKNGADKTLKTDFDETAYDLAKENEALQKQDINFLK